MNNTILSDNLEMIDLISEITPKVKEMLTPIGGHKVYHLEGNAWEHTILVMEAMQKRGLGYFGILIGLVHDIGKGRHFVVDDEGWFTYPGHAPGGAEMLKEFIPESDCRYSLLEWLVRNHIKTLFLKGLKDLKKLETTVPAPWDPVVAIRLLLNLGLADLDGSFTVESERASNEALRNKLEEYLLEYNK